ncbi:MAG: T9SS type A sorting domain-containing protein, partial [Candidatus Neomarinimicrobiota bacterium]|nr:T9SS type A sorting domain-containing protein [Candidatus Neomarinimicrobiota bacterium]
VNGNNEATCLTIVGNSTVSFSGFSLRSGLGNNGGGIFIEGSGAVTLDQLHVFSNLASNDGGGLFVSSINSGSVILTNSKFYTNECVNKGGGMNIQDDNTVIQGTLIYSNSTQQDAGGIYTSGKLKVLNSTFASNRVPSGRNGAAMMIETGLDSSLLVNNIFYNNDDGIYKSNGKLVAYNNYFSEIDAQLDIIRGSGNTFSDVDPFVNASNKDYSLSSTSNQIGSGRLNTVFYGTNFAVPAIDANGTVRPSPAGSNPDLGAIENTLATAIPSVVSITSSESDGTYNLGSVISISVTFSEPVSVTGTPQLQLETGSTDRVANYVSGMDTTILTFSYTVQEGDTTRDLDYNSTAALLLNGGTIFDSDSSGAHLTLPTKGGQNSISGSKALAIDGLSPSIISVSSLSADSSYSMNSQIPIQLTFSEPVTVSGTPQLVLETGYDDAIVDYNSGSGGNVLTFLYTVQSSDNSLDLEYHTSNPLNLNSGSIIDTAGNNALLPMPSIGSGNSLSDNKDIFVNGSVPRVVSVSSSSDDGFFIAGDTLMLTVSFNESVIVTGVPQLKLRTGSSNARASYISGTNTNTLVFRYIISSLDNTRDLDYATDSSLTFNGGNIVDVLGSAGVLELPIPGSSNSLKGSKTLIIDNSAPIFTAVSEGAIISSGGTDKDFQNLADTLFVSWAASDSGTSVANYQYAIGINAGGSQIVPWTSAGTATADTVVFPSYQPLIEGGTYFLSVIATDIAGNVSSPSLGDGIVIDLTSPVAGTVFDGIISDLSYTGSDSSLVISWSGFSDSRSGISSYKLSIQDEQNNNVLSWSDIPDTNSWIVTNLSLNNASTYQVSLRGVDGAGNLSSIVSTNGIIIDTESPQEGIARDGSIGDMDWHNSDTTITFTWNDFNDSLSGISSYEYAIGTNTNITQQLNWTTALRSDTMATVSISFEGDSTYFVSIRAIDSVSNVSNTVTSDGFTIDMEAPEIYYVNEGSISSDIDIQNIDSVLSSSWQGIDISPGSEVSYYEVALGTSRGDSNTVDWYSTINSYTLNMLGDSTHLNDGATYYVSVRAIDHAGNRSDVLISDGILIDLTPPLLGTIRDGLDVDIDFTQSTTTLSANWLGFIDTVSNIVNYDVAFTDDTSRFDIISWDSVGLISNYTIDTLSSLADQETYFFVIKATDLAGNISRAFSSDGVTIDYGTPVSGIVYDGLTGDSDWTNSDSTFDISWSGFIDTVSGIVSYEYAIGTTPGASNVISWTGNGVDTTVVVNNLDLTHDGTYYGSVRATDVVGHVSTISTSNGIVVDIFDPTVGVPNDGGFVDLDYQGPSDTLGIFWSGNDTREIAFYEYSVGSSPGDTNIISWMDNGSETQVTIPNFSLTHESVYYANIRAYDMAGNVSTIESSDGIMADLHPPTIGFVNDGLDDDESYTASDTNLVANWDGFADTTSGIMRYEYAVGTIPGSTDITGSWISAESNNSISADLILEETITYYFSIRAIDQVNNISSVVSSNGIITDFTGPAGTWVFDGDSVDIDRQNYTDSYQSHWKQFDEQGSGFLTYEYALYNMDNSQYVTSWTQTLDTLCNISELSLEENITYNVHVRGIDSVNNVGEVLMSNGVLIDLSAPASPMNLVAWFTSERIFIEWDHNQEVDLNHYSVYGGTEADPTTLLFTTSDSSAEAFMPTYEDGNTYYFRITATDIPGNESPFTNDVMGIPQSALITRENPNPDTFLNASDTTLTIHFTQPLNYVGDITATSIAYDNMNLYSTYSPEDTAIIIHFTDPYASYDTIHIEISNILDWSDNETDTKQLTYTTYLLADYDNDFDIDVLDLNSFKTALTNQDFSYELGPITGTVPHFIPTPNNIFDLRDVMAFVQMWYWSNSSLPLIVGTMPEIGSRIEIEQIDQSIVVSLPEGSAAGQVFIEYPPSSKKFSTKADITNEDHIYLSSTDDHTGKILIEWSGSIDDNETEIIIDSYSFDRNDMPISIGYSIYGLDNEVISQGMKSMQIRAIPDEYSLHHNYPNPFNPSTTILYDIPTAGHTRLLIYDLLGREVATLVNKNMDAGYYTTRWDGRNQHGQSVGAGMYFYHLQSGPYRKSLKMLLVK